MPPTMMPPGTNGHGSGPFSGLLGPDGQPMRRFPVSHEETFGSIYNQSTRVYRWTFDEALRHSETNAQAMRRDAFLMDCLRERATARAMRLASRNGPAR